jgi:CRP/FNR family transcriptional regulator
MESRAGTTNQVLIAELEAIGSKVSFAAGDRIQTEGEPGQGIYVLHSGTARVSMLAGGGEVVQLRDLQPGSLIGLSSTLSCDHCCYTVQALEPCQFTFVPAVRAQEFLRARTDLCLEAIRLLGREMSSLCNERAVINARMQTVQIRTGAQVQRKL